MATVGDVEESQDDPPVMIPTLDEQEEDVRTPLLRGSSLALLGNRVVWVYYKHKRLPWFCYHCGRLGHIAKDCAHVDDTDLLNPALYQYGEELRASPLKRTLSHQQEPNLVSARRKLVFKPSSLTPEMGSEDSFSRQSRVRPQASKHQGVERQGFGASHVKGLVEVPIQRLADLLTPTRGVSKQLERLSVKVDKGPRAGTQSQTSSFVVDSQISNSGASEIHSNCGAAGPR
ncbi:hypothetical protein Tsubulata_023742 [Turnera subulata]|uniref:CCHC-type domain-containing protein n=1 Tax=Turnera subulata TaxID=218843 RepID=A0A9Q0JFZ2_9ROSI|nr:hypothetical protein Tsubulata_023742 [Turnera subulata]